ncbi:methyl-accepting chemotaxis protein [Terrarubrum flagellatum]|uniref:methyl-accepting chemotaxis protein n=1 Tax=Terrirubrum flagellatum TaxID=2895980 RepID=UPI00314564B9
MRVATLACIPLLALIVTLGAGGLMREYAERALSEARSSSATVHLAEDLSDDARIIELETQTFLLDRNRGADETMKEKLAALGPRIDRLSADRALGARTGAIKEHAKALADALDAALAVRWEMTRPNGVSARATVTGVALENFMADALSRYNSPGIYKMTIAALRMRRAGQQYANQRNIQQVFEFESSAAEFSEIAKSAAMNPDDAEMAGRLVPAYLAAFREWVEIARQLDQSAWRLTEASQSLTTALAEISKEAGKNAAKQEQEAEAAKATLGWLEWALPALAVLLTCIAALLLARSIRHSLNALRVSMLEIKQGQNHVEIEGLERSDEIGQMARALSVFRDHAAERQMAVADQIAQSEIREALLADRERRVAVFEDAFNNELATFQLGVRDLSATSNSLAELSENFVTSATSATQAVGGATEDVTSVAIATEELSYSIGEVSARTEESRNSAETMSTTLAAATTIMDRLNQSASDIGDVIGLIQRIAMQTNLLSLNATIEAARAGEAGRGFAVVAQEVKGLASQTEHATGDVRALIEQLRAVAGEAHDAFDTIAKSISHLVDNTIGIATAITQQKQGIDEINMNLQSASSRSRSGAESMQQLRDLAGRAAESARRVQTVAESIDRGAVSLDGEVERFLTSVRAA